MLYTTPQLGLLLLILLPFVSGRHVGPLGVQELSHRKFSPVFSIMETGSRSKLSLDSIPESTGEPISADVEDGPLRMITYGPHLPHSDGS